MKNYVSAPPKCRRFICLFCLFLLLIASFSTVISHAEDGTITLTADSATGVPVKSDKPSATGKPTTNVRSPEQQPASPSFYAKLWRTSLIFGIILLPIFLWKANDPNAGQQVFYVLLLPMGTAAGAFLFGAMRSYATYRGEAFNGLLELGGLVVIFAMVVIGGFKLVPNAKSFNLSVYVHGPGGRQDMVLKNQGEVILDLADNRRSEAINEKGAAYFSGIPAEFFNCEVPVMIQASGFESAETDKKAVLKSGGVYLQVRRDDSLAKITGTVKSADGDFLKGVSIRIGKLKTRTDEGGYFELKIPPENQKARQKLIALLEGYETWEGNVHPGTRQDVGIVLSEKTPKQV